MTSQKHSTVWDGAETLFDINFLALGVDADEAWRLANGRELKVGREKRCYVLQRGPPGDSLPGKARTDDAVTAQDGRFEIGR